MILLGIYSLIQIHGFDRGIPDVMPLIERTITLGMDPFLPGYDFSRSRTKVGKIAYSFFLREKPDFSSKKIIKVEKGDKVSVLSSKGIWLLVQKEKHQGWIPSVYVDVYAEKVPFLKRNLTKRDLAVMIVKTVDYHVPEKKYFMKALSLTRKLDYTDVSAKDPAYGFIYICTRELNLMTGRAVPWWNSTEFNPDHEVTREEFVATLIELLDTTTGHIPTNVYLLKEAKKLQQRLTFLQDVSYPESYLPGFLAVADMYLKEKDPIESGLVRSIFSPPFVEEQTSESSAGNRLFHPKSKVPLWWAMAIWGKVFAGAPDITRTEPEKLKEIDFSYESLSEGRSLRRYRTYYGNPPRLIPFPYALEDGWDFFGKLAGVSRSGFIKVEFEGTGKTLKIPVNPRAYVYYFEEEKSTQRNYMELTVGFYENGKAYAYNEEGSLFEFPTDQQLMMGEKIGILGNYTKYIYKPKFCEGKDFVSDPHKYLPLVYEKAPIGGYWTAPREKGKTRPTGKLIKEAGFIEVGKGTTWYGYRKAQEKVVIAPEKIIHLRDVNGTLYDFSLGEESIELDVAVKTRLGTLREKNVRATTNTIIYIDGKYSTFEELAKYLSTQEIQRNLEESLHVEGNLKGNTLSFLSISPSSGGIRESHKKPPK